jgi:hypothetical protein
MAMVHRNRIQGLPSLSRVTLAAVLLAFVAGTGCTTNHASGEMSGYSETRLFAMIYQLQFHGNGYTSSAHVQEILMRRAAELALENDFRYFIFDVPQNLDRRDLWGQCAERGIAVIFLLSPTPGATDAVAVIEDTDEAASGLLSPRALDAFAWFKLQEAGTRRH